MVGCRRAYLHPCAEHNSLWYEVRLTLYVHVPLVYHNHEYTEVCAPEVQGQELALL